MTEKLHADVAIITVLPEEYDAVCKKVSDLQPPHLDVHNVYAWKVGTIGSYKVAVGMMSRAGNVPSEAATIDAIWCFDPRYIFFVGIAGGLCDLAKGDVIIADTIYGYEYGKIEKRFMPRSNWAYRTDLGLLNGAAAHARTPIWKRLIQTNPPQEASAKVISGEIASGDKVVDNPAHSFFAEVRRTWPKIKAVEMEGAGLGCGIDYAQAQGRQVGFLMIRGISDLPRAPESKHDTGKQDQPRSTRERDTWKKYAADTAAAFAISYISDGLPTPPRPAEPPLSNVPQDSGIHLLGERCLLTEPYITAANTSDRIDIITLTMQVVLENYGEIRMTRWLKEGKTIRILVLSPVSMAAKIRGKEEGRDSLAPKIIRQIERLKNIYDDIQAQLAGDKNFLGSLEVRLYDGIPYFAYFCTERTLIIGLYYSHVRGLQSEAISIDVKSPVYTKMQGHFEVLWNGQGGKSVSLEDRVICKIAESHSCFVDLPTLKKNAGIAS